MKGRVKAPIIPSGSDFRLVKNNGTLDEDRPLLFTFSNFKMESISIGEFNNFYKDQQEYLRKVTVLISQALPLLSNEKMSIFNDAGKMKALHLHKIKGKEDILRNIFCAYNFSQNAIDNFLEGADIYQLEVPFENGASRVVFEKIGNLISFLFLDPNHHIYINRRFVDGNGSLFYEYCPLNENDDCDRMNYLKTCFAFEFLDIEKYNESYGNAYSYEKKD